MDKKNFVKISPKDKNIEKEWFLYFNIPDDRFPGKFKRKKIIDDINTYSTVESRLQRCKEIIERIEKQEQSNKNDGRYLLPIKNFLSESIRLRTSAPGQKKTRQKYNGQLNMLVKWCGLDKLQTFSSNDAHEFIAYLYASGKTSNTVKSYKVILKSLFEDLVKDKKIKSNPFEHVRVSKPNPQSAEYFTSEESAMLINYIQQADPQLALAVKLIYYCTIRPKEIRLLQVKHVQLHRSKIKIYGEVSKNNQYEDVRIPPKLMTEINQQIDLSKYDGELYLFGKYGLPGEIKVGTNSLYNRHRKFLKALNFGENYDLYHSWKNTAACRMCEANINAKQIQTHLRHSSLEITDQYLKKFNATNIDYLINHYPDI